LSQPDGGEVVIGDVVDRRRAQAGLHERRLRALEGCEEVEPACAHEQDVARAELDTGRGTTRLEVVGADVRPRLEPIDALVAGDVEEHGATGEPARLLDAAVRRAVVDVNSCEECPLYIWSSAYTWHSASMCVPLCAGTTSTSSLAPTPSSAPYGLFISASVWLVSVSRCGAPRYGNTGVP
jgi:hypothetical protein